MDFRRIVTAVIIATVIGLVIAPVDTGHIWSAIISGIGNFLHSLNLH